jgi:hypothetical protein
MSDELSSPAAANRETKRDWRELARRNLERERADRARYTRGKFNQEEWLEAVHAAIEDGFPIYPMTARKAFAIGGVPIKEIRKEPAGVDASWFEWEYAERKKITFATLMTGVAGSNGKVFVGLDIDNKRDRDGLTFLERWGLSAEEGYATPNGGLHFVFDWDDSPVPPTTPGNGFAAFPGVEVKGSGNHGNLIMWGEGYEACYLESVLPRDRFPAELLEQPEMRPREVTGSIAAVRVEVEIQRLVENLGLLQATREGGWLSFCCPLHRDKDPSAGINLETGVFNCFVCGSLSLIDFYADASGMSRREAFWRLTRDHEEEFRTAAELEAEGYSHYEATDADLEPPDDEYRWRQCRLPSCQEWLRWNEDGTLLIDRHGREHLKSCQTIREGDVEIAWADDTDEPYWRLRKKRAVKHVRGGVSGQRRVKGISNKYARLKKVWRLREQYPDMLSTKFVEEVLTNELELSGSQAWKVWRQSKYGDRSNFTRQDMLRL